MIVFLLIVLSIYSLINFYIFRRGWQSLAGFPRVRWLYAAIFLVLILSYPLGRIALGFGKNSLTQFFVRFGSFHLALMLYLFLGVILVDLVRLANAVRPFLPRSWSAHPQQMGLALFLLVAGASLLVIIGGVINAYHPRLRELALSIDKPGNGRKNLTIVMASDLHLGLISGSPRLKKLVDRINALTPDIVLMPGDIVDETVTAKEEEDMISIFQEIRAPLGTFSVPGNHETYSGLEQNIAFLTNCGVHVLQDEAALVGNSFTILGRRDPSAMKRGDKREGLGRIMARNGVDSRLPLILLDHQPFRLEEAREAGIDLQLSGHTHAGQLFPLNLINKRIYEQYWGYLRKGATQYYISCGVGTWGPPVRTGSIPEIVRIRLTFKDMP